MADTLTTNYNLTKPEIGASNDSWGTKINANLDVLDTQLKAVSNVANAALPAASYTAADVLAKILTVDGAGSGLDADALDGQSSAYYVDIPSRLGYTPLNAASYTAADVLAKLLTVDGAGSGLDADLLDGNQAAFFQPALGYTPVNRAGDTMTGNLTILSNVLQVGVASAGAGGNIRLVDDSGTFRYLLGFLGTAANTVFSIFDAVAGANRIAIPTSGNVGIGIDAPAAKLHIGGSVANAIQGRFTNGVDDPNFSLVAVNGAAGSVLGTKVGSIGLHYGSSGPAAVVNFFRGDTISDGAIAFETNTVERMRIDRSGNVGIGTSSINGKAEILSSGAQTSLTLRNNAQTINTYSEILFAPFTGTTAASAYIRNLFFTNNNSALTFATTNSAAAPVERMRIDESGNVGIGATSISALGAGYTTLAIQGVNGGGARMYSGATECGRIYGDVSLGLIVQAVGAAAPMSLYTNGAERMRIDASGNVGIGGTSNGAKLDVYGDINARSGTVSADTITNWGSNLVLNSGGGLPIIFQGNGTERMRITNAGDVGIGVSPIVKLHVKGATDTIQQIIGGVTRGIRFSTDTVSSVIEGVDQTGTVAFQPLTLGGSYVSITGSGAEHARFQSANLRVLGDVFVGSVTAGIEVGYRDIPRVTGALERGKAFATAAGVTLGAGGPSNTGEAYSIYNDSASPITLTQGSGLTLRLGGTTTTGNRTLAPRGFATVWYNSGTEAIVSGSGVT